MNMVRKSIGIKNIEITAIEKHPVPVLGVDYKVKIIYKNVKFPQVDVENFTIKISLPNKYKKCDNKEILNLAIEKLYEQIAIVEIENAMEKMRVMLKIAPEDYKIKKMKNVFGKCENKKITINPEVVKYSRRFIEYVVLHEYCHLKYKNHCKGFYEMIEEYEPDYERFGKVD